MKHKALALPIRCRDFSNSSQIVSLLTPRAGLVEGIARGAHRPKSAFQGPFDLLVLREVIYIPRRSPHLAILDESEVLDGFRGIRRVWHRYIGACHVLEFLRVVSVPGEPSPELFELTIGTLRGIGQSERGDLASLLLRFEVRALRLLGFLGDIDACVACQRRWPGGRRPAYFSPRSGGLLCRRCAPARESGNGPREAVSGAGVRALQRFAAGSEPRSDDASLSAPTVRRLHGLLHQSCAFFLDRPLEMFKFSAAWLE